jgi:hypothetical protein
VVGQVKVVGILMLVHGITVVIMGGILAAVGIWILARVGGGGAGGAGGEPMIVGVVYTAWGLMIVALGILNSVAGVRVMSFRNRVLGLVALFSNILVLFSCYCALTAIGMMVYGLIVLFHSDVAYAFDLVSRGSTPEEVVGRLTRRYGDARDDYDELNTPRRQWEDDQYDRREDLDRRSEDEEDRR